MNESFGPWSTAMTTGTNPQLNTFWKRRLAMLSSLKQSNSRVAGRTALVLGILAFGALAVPTLQWVAETGLAGQPNLSGTDVPAENEAQGNQVPAKASRPTAAEPAIADEYFPRPTAAERQILEALEKPIDVSFQGTALEKCIESLATQAKIDVWINQDKLTEEGVAIDQPITLKFKGRRLESVLNLLLSPVQLTYIYEDEVLKITTSASASDILITRTYPVGDLCPDFAKISPPFGGAGGGFFAVGDLRSDCNDSEEGSGHQAMNTNAIRPPLQSALFQAFGGGGSGRGGAPAEDNAQPQENGPAKKSAVPHYGITVLMDAISSTVEPDSWELLSGPGSMMPVEATRSLVIRQTWSVHKKVLQLLRDLRAAKRLPQGATARAVRGAGAENEERPGRGAGGGFF
jgi:hypothetical protein